MVNILVFGADLTTIMYAKLNDSSSHGGILESLENDTTETKNTKQTPEKPKTPYCIVDDDDDDDDCTVTVDESSRDESIWSAVAREEGENGMKDELNGTTVVVIQAELQEDSILHDHSTRKECLIVLLKQSLPVIAAFFFQYAGTFTSLLFASHYTNKEDGSMVFAGVSLSNMFANVTCLSLLVGMTAGIETLASQYNGAQQYTEVGATVWRCMVILWTMLFPISIIWYNSRAIFLAIGIEESVCQVIGNYLQIRALLLPIDVINISYEKYLMAVGVVAPTFYSSIVFNIVLLSCNSLFTLHLGLDYTFLAWSWVIAEIVSLTFMISISWYHPSVQRTLQPFSPTSAFSSWWQFISLGLPATAMLCSEWWAYEGNLSYQFLVFLFLHSLSPFLIFLIFLFFRFVSFCFVCFPVLSLFASFLGTEAIAAQVVIFQTAAFLFMIPLGLGIATASVVGNAIGAKKRLLAIKMAHLSLAIVVVIQSMMAVLVTFKGYLFINFFTPDEHVRAIANQTLLYMGLFVFLDSIQGTCSGVLRGSGKQLIGALTNLVGFYVIGLPL